MEPLVFIVVLNWHGWQDTITCLQSLLQLTHSNYRIVIVDNGSTDDSIDKIRAWSSRTPQTVSNTSSRSSEKDPVYVLEYDRATAIKGGIQELEATDRELKPNGRIVLIRNDKNLGYAGGNNVGIRYALERGADYIWILNNDTEVNTSSVSDFLNCAQQNKNIGMWGSTIVDYYKRYVIQCAGGAKYVPILTLNKYALRGMELALAVEYTKSIKLDYISGASIFIRADVLRQVGLFNEEHFLYYEEIDLARRCKKAGYGIGWCRSSIVAHKEGSVLGSNSSDIRRKSLQSEYFSNLSSLTYTKNHHRHLLPAVYSFRFMLKSLLFLTKRQPRFFKPLIQAYRDFTSIKAYDDHLP